MNPAKLAIYLAGPITGQTVQDMSTWRDKFKENYRDRFVIKSPLDRDRENIQLCGKARHKAIAYGERKDILNCDATIALLDPRSMGTAMGIMYAYLSGRTVVLITKDDPSGLSPMVQYHSHCICSTFEEAVVYIERRHARRSIDTIINREGERVPFEYSKIQQAIAKAVRGLEKKTGEKELPDPEKLANAVVMQIEDAIEDGELGAGNIELEIIQDYVEKILMHNGHRNEVCTLAKEYIKYRWNRQYIRERGTDDENVMKKITDLIHNFKSPAGNIDRLLDFLQKDLESGNVESAKQLLTPLQKNKSSLVSLIYNSKDQFEGEYQSAEINLRLAINGILPQFHSQFKIEVDVADDLWVKMPKERMNTVFCVLLENSRKHGAAKNVHIRAEVNDDGKLVVKYWNDGREISKEKAAKIFTEREVQYKSGDGFKHGLSQVQRYVEQANGTIECELVPGAGRESGVPVFRITLPLHRAGIQKSIVLVADDDANDRWMMRKILDDGGLEVVEAENITAAVEIIVKTKLFGAVLDVDFREDKNGLWLLKQLRKHHPAARAIVVSGSSPTTANWQREASNEAAAVFDKQNYTPQQILNVFGVAG